jgi:alginate O-acetyltransferase complex protein AlgI
MLTSGGASELRRKALLYIGLVWNFSALAVFKYFDQLAAMIVPSAGPILGITIPAGISFYTFHQSVFLLNAFTREGEAVSFLEDSRNILGKLATFIRYGAFVAFFLQLVIGPIAYMSEFGPQVQRRNFGRLRVIDLQVGVTLIVIGLYKKLCIADVLAEIVNPIYTALHNGLLISQTDAVFGIVGYFFQLYFDFSGYSDIAIGIARLFGIRLPINFNSPLRATSISDFYRRWHITLTQSPLRGALI